MRYIDDQEAKFGRALPENGMEVPISLYCCYKSAVNIVVICNGITLCIVGILAKLSRNPLY